MDIPRTPPHGPWLCCARKINAAKPEKSLKNCKLKKINPNIF
jgi:hypothetical protein